MDDCLISFDRPGEKLTLALCNKTHRGGGGWQSDVHFGLPGKKKNTLTLPFKLAPTETTVHVKVNMDKDWRVYCLFFEVGQLETNS